MLSEVNSENPLFAIVILTFLISQFSYYLTGVNRQKSGPANFSK